MHSRGKESAQCMRDQLGPPSLSISLHVQWAFAVAREILEIFNPIQYGGGGGIMEICSGDWGVLKLGQVETVTIFSRSRCRCMKFIHEVSHTII